MGVPIFLGCNRCLPKDSSRVKKSPLYTRERFYREVLRQTGTLGQCSYRGNSAYEPPRVNAYAESTPVQGSLMTQPRDRAVLQSDCS